MSFQGDLFPYQQPAFDAFLARGNLLLAFDVGLGKTATSIAIAEELLETRAVRCVLLVVPASLKFQWAKSLAKFTDLPVTGVKVKGETVTIPDQDACVIVDGTPERRAKQYARAAETRAEYVIVGYDQCVSEWREIQALDPGLVVCDEASLLKTPGAKRTKAIKKHFAAPYRLALTATPIENRPEEVYSIMRWVDETVLGRYDLFDKSYIVRDPFGGVQRYKNLDLLYEKLSEAMVRKTRADPEVQAFMPDVINETWNVELDDETRAAYKLMMQDLLRAYDEVSITGSFDVHAHYGAARDDPRGDKSGLGKLMSIHGVVEQFLNHPALVAQSANLYQTTDDRGSKYASDLMLSGRELPSTSPKLDDLADHVSFILDDDPGAKILIFCRNKLMLRLIADRFPGTGSVIYDGDLSVKAKEAAVTRFKGDPGTRLFISSHAGAYGTDLPEASWLINYDVARSAGMATQINGRHVRASSGFDSVHVRDMVCTGTVESRNHDRSRFKGKTSAAIIDGHSDSGRVENDLTSLKSHAEAVTADDPAVS